VTAGERNAEGDITRRTLDYRVLQPWLVCDANRNRSAVAFDALGMVAGTAVMGKPEESLGDSLESFCTDLTQAEIEQFLADPKGPMTTTLLGNATTRIVYDLTAYRREPDPARKPPAVAATLARETHVSDLQAGQQTKIQVSLSYSDGFGREIQKKVQAEPGPAPRRDDNGKIVVDENGQPVMTAHDVSPRWVGSGWTIFNNKGKPVRKYEPFFTDTHRFEFAVRIGVSPVLFYDPAGRVVATLHPNHSWEKVVFDPWRQETWDVNDTLLIANPGADPEVGGLFRRVPDAEYQPTWHALRTDPAHAAAFAQRYPDVTDRANETQAARKTEVHAGTPSVTYADSLGRPFLTVAHNRARYSDMPSDAPSEEAFLATRVVFDIEGNQREVIDAKGRVVMRYDYDLLGNRIHQASMEAGQRWMLNDVTGNPVRAWDSRDHRFRTAYDPLRRPTDTFLSEGGGTEVVVGQTLYGESRPNPEADNLRGQVVELRDQAGVVTSDRYDFKGNLLRSGRRLAQDYKNTLDWSGTVPLESETYTSRTRYDALSRPIQLVAPHSDQPGAKINVIQLGYNEANLLERVDAWLEQSAEPATLLDPATANLHAVTDIDYNAKGERERIAYGNGAVTTYAYDPLTFRLTQLLTRRRSADFPDDCPQSPPAEWPGCQVQNLRYTYDPAGNITHIRDDAQQTIFFRNKRVEPSAEYTYDAIYRLIEATGREHLGQGGTPAPHSYNDAPRVGLLHPGDGNAMGRYLERYVYDAVGNFLEMQHRSSDPAHPGWTRTYAYDETSQLEPGRQSNRLTRTTIGGTTETYSASGDGYDTHGNMLRMPHLQVMQWDFNDQLRMSRRQAVNAADTDSLQHQGERTWYVYDATGQRVRKVTERADGQVKDERIYLGGFEICRDYNGNGTAVKLERETLHIMDDTRRIAMVETKTVDEANDGSPARLVRYQFGNHLDSASLELDGQAQVISYEEYSPYGSTVYQAVNQTIGAASKRYRYTGKKRDEELGFSYHSARYYAPWLGRWPNCDPVGVEDGISLYEYASNNPINKKDITGLSGEPSNFVEYAESIEEGVKRIGTLGVKHSKEYGLGRAANGRLLILEGGHESVFFGKLDPIAHSHTGTDTTPSPSTTDLNLLAERGISEHWILSKEGWSSLKYDAKTESFDYVVFKEEKAFEGKITLNPKYNPSDTSPMGQASKWEYSELTEVKNVPELRNRLEPSRDTLGRRGVRSPSGSVPGSWVTKTGRGIHVLGKGLGLFGAFMSGYRIVSALRADISQGTGGRQTAKALAVEGGGWGAAGAGALLGAKAGAVCGFYAEICSPLGAIGLGAVGYWGGSEAVKVLINTSGRRSNRRYRNVAPGEVLDTKTNRVFIKVMP